MIKRQRSKGKSIVLYLYVQMAHSCKKSPGLLRRNVLCRRPIRMCSPLNRQTTHLDLFFKCIPREKFSYGFKKEGVFVMSEVVGFSFVDFDIGVKKRTKKHCAVIEKYQKNNLGRTLKRYKLSKHCGGLGTKWQKT